MNRQFVTGAAMLRAIAGTAMGQGQEGTSPDAVRAIVAEMMADAQDRTSLLAADAGHDGGFFIAGDGFRLEIEGQIQFRYLLNFRDESNSDDFESGFQTRRTKLTFAGTVHDDWDFQIKAAFDRDGGAFVLEDAWVSHDLSDDVRVRFGQYKTAFLREENVSATRQLTADRSVMNEIFNQDYAQGVELAYAQETWKAAVSFTDGFGSDNSEFASSGEADFAVTGRVEVLLAGDSFTPFKDFTSPRGSEFGALLGGAIHYQEMTVGKGSQTGAPTDTDVALLTYTADLSLEGDGWNAFAAFVGRNSEVTSLGGDLNLDDFGVVAQGGVRVAENTELFGRWDAVFLDDERGIADDTFHFLTVGVNQYYAGHAAKATVDVVVALDETSDLSSVRGFPNAGLGLLGDGEDSEFVVRFQFQLLF